MRNDVHDEINRNNRSRNGQSEVPREHIRNQEPVPLPVPNSPVEYWITYRAIIDLDEIMHRQVPLYCVPGWKPILGITNKRLGYYQCRSCLVIAKDALESGGQPKNRGQDRPPPQILRRQRPAMTQLSLQREASWVQECLFIHDKAERAIERHLGDSSRGSAVVDGVLSSIRQPFPLNRVATGEQPKAAYLLCPFVSDLPIFTPIETDFLADSSDTLGCFKQCSYTCFGSIAA